MDVVFRAVDRLKPFCPDFVSVTYGAGGSTRAFTEEIVTRIKTEANLEVMAHQTCVGQTEEEVHNSLVRLEAAGIENVIALRGDMPRVESGGDSVNSGFSHASHLIGHIRGNFKFGVAAACYPEGHTESIDMNADIEHTKLKVNLGADFLITQLFYNNNDYFEFVDRAQKSGIDVPIIPGILPILSTNQVRRFTTLCGAKIPEALDQRLEQFIDDDNAVREIGVEHATRQVQELWDANVPGVHFYVLNRSYSVSKILTNLELRGHGANPEV
jgi:methylenetetrahydrofolate reductase (NADPH)